MRFEYGMTKTHTQNISHLLLCDATMVRRMCLRIIRSYIACLVVSKRPI